MTYRFWFSSFKLQYRNNFISCTCRGSYSGHWAPHSWMQGERPLSSFHCGSLSILLRRLHDFPLAPLGHMGRAHHWSNGNSSTSWKLLKDNIFNGVRLKTYNGKNLSSECPQKNWWLVDSHLSARPTWDQLQINWHGFVIPYVADSLSPLPRLSFKSIHLSYLSPGKLKNNYI